MMVRLTLDGASKCALRDFLLEEWRAELILVILEQETDANGCSYLLMCVCVFIQWRKSGVCNRCVGSIKCFLLFEYFFK